MRKTSTASTSAEFKQQNTNSKIKKLIDYVNYQVTPTFFTNSR